ncbi:hypothetical protein HK105_204586 [Polyrhizophydium stewartii]|uniref:Transglutaminase-like domain-containing protein n=1 Tax=Polyrhizophydium stewartii TaxID=2732419 RepID=A0ABR4N8Q4_9FUNG
MFDLHAARRRSAPPPTGALASAAGSEPSPPVSLTSSPRSTGGRPSLSAVFGPLSLLSAVSPAADATDADPALRAAGHQQAGDPDPPLLESAHDPALLVFELEDVTGSDSGGAAGQGGVGAGMGAPRHRSGGSGIGIGIGIGIGAVDPLSPASTSTPMPIPTVVSRRRRSSRRDRVLIHSASTGSLFPVTVLMPSPSLGSALSPAASSGLGISPGVDGGYPPDASAVAGSAGSAGFAALASSYGSAESSLGIGSYGAESLGTSSFGAGSFGAGSFGATGAMRLSPQQQQQYHHFQQQFQLFQQYQQQQSPTQQQLLAGAAYSPISESSIRNEPHYLPSPANAPARADIVMHEDAGISDVKRLCMPSAACGDWRMSAAAWGRDFKIVYAFDEAGRRETQVASLRPQSAKPVHCCGVPRTLGMCDPAKWVFQGSEYDSALTLMYARMDGCIPSYVKLVEPKFIIPWRYKNRKTGAISWKIIHMCGDNVQDAESETIVVNIHRDHKLRELIASVRTQAASMRDVELAEYLLAVIRELMGDYGLPGGATSTQADASLLKQMQQQGHNFMLLTSVRIGLCRHKALLFKILSDAVGLDCALVTGYSTGGRHQWNVITLSDGESFIIDPTSPHFTWTKHGSFRTKAYRISADMSFGHGGLTLKKMGVL